MLVLVFPPQGKFCLHFFYYYLIPIVHALESLLLSSNPDCDRLEKLDLSVSSFISSKNLPAKI